MAEKNNELNNQIKAAIVNVGDEFTRMTEDMARQIREAIERLARMRYEMNRAVLSSRLSGAMTIPSLEKTQAFSDALIPLENALSQIEKDLMAQNEDVKKLEETSPKVKHATAKVQKELTKLTMFTKDIGKDIQKIDPEKLDETTKALNKHIQTVDNENQILKNALRDQSQAKLDKNEPSKSRQIK